MYTLNGTVWAYFVWFGQILASCFNPENVSYNHCYLGCFQNALAFQNEKQKTKKKHQVMNVHTKWNYGNV